MTVKKASEVLIEILEGQKEILGHLRNHDMLLKQLLTKSTPSVAPPPAPTTMPGLKPGVVLNTPKVEDEYDFQSVDEQPVGKRKDLKSSSGNDVTTFQQKVVLPNGFPCPSAKVDIYTISPGTNSLVQIDTKKTNTAGKYSGQLPPGEYFVKVFKKGGAKEGALNAEKKITVPRSSEPEQLEQIVLK